MAKTLLVADNSITIQKMVGISLAQEDFSITYVDNGEDALKKAKEVKPDVVLADIDMPKMSGYDVAQALRQDPGLKNTAILLLAGMHQPFDESRGKSSGADGHIIKPFESQILIDRVRQAMDAKLASPKAPPPPTPQPKVSTPPPADKPVANAPKPTIQPSSAPQTQVANPAGTIAGQSAYVPPSPQAANPAGTIAGQSPVVSPPTPPSGPKVDLGNLRDAPMLDLDLEAAPMEESPPVEASSFDFSFDGDLATHESIGLDTAPTPPTEPKFELSGSQEAATEDHSLWDFAGETEISPAPQIKIEPDIIESTPDRLNETSESKGPNEGVDFSSASDFDFSTSETEITAFEESVPTEEASNFDFSSSETEMILEPPAMVQPGDYAGLDEPEAQEIHVEETPLLGQDPLAPSAAEVASSSLGGSLSDAQIEAIVTKVFQKVIERIAWEVVPDMAETIIREELTRLTKK